MQDLIEAYTKIRKIPYKIVELDYTLENSCDLINANAASCTPKHIVLADQFKKMGFETIFCIHEFNWTDFKIDYPKKLKTILSIYPTDIHTNLELKLNSKWIMVDATWDDPLINCGMPGTLDWDGKKSTKNNVLSKKSIRFSSLAERNDYIKTTKDLFAKDKNIQIELTKELNAFFDQLRK